MTDNKLDPRPYISPDFNRLLRYMVKYRNLRGKASARIIVEQLILAYAKQLATGMPEKLWQDNIIVLINLCEQEHKEKFKNEVKQYENFQRRTHDINRTPYL